LNLGWSRPTLLDTRHHGNAWSTRFMFRNGTKGEVYAYPPSGDGYDKDA
jgi:hypothetical protein